MPQNYDTSYHLIGASGTLTTWVIKYQQSFGHPPLNQYLIRDGCSDPDGVEKP